MVMKAGGYMHPEFIVKAINYLKRKIIEFRKRKLLLDVKVYRPKYGLNNNPRDQKIIVSLTSYPERFEYVYMTLKSLLRQDMKPDRIILWYDCDYSYLTENMRSLMEYGIEYIHVDIDLKPHKKYYFAMNRFPDDIVITVDDDVVYPSDLVSSLYDTHIRFPDCVCARRVHLITFRGNQIDSYSNWIFEYVKSKRPDYKLFAVGVGGVLYPPHCLNEEAFDINNLKMCLEADDIWLKCMQLLKRTKVVWTPNKMVHPPIIEGSQKNALFSENFVNNRNDEYICILMKKYGERIRKVIGD